MLCVGLAALQWLVLQEMDGSAPVEGFCLFYSALLDAGHKCEGRACLALFFQVDAVSARHNHPRRHRERSAEANDFNLALLIFPLASEHSEIGGIAG